MLRNKVSYIFLIMLVVNCNSTSQIQKPSESEFYSLWDHSITPISSPQKDIKSETAPIKKKK